MFDGVVVLGVVPSAMLSTCVDVLGIFVGTAQGRVVE